MLAMKQEKTSRRIPEEQAASLEEIEAAIESLTKEDSRRLEQFAKWRIRGINRSRSGRNHEDLLQEAIRATLSGVELDAPNDRRWKKGTVNFVRHLIGAMRSISSHWREQFDPDEAFSESEVIRVSPDGKVTNPVRDVASSVPGINRVIEAKAAVEHIERLVAGHSLSSLIIDGLREGMTGPEIQRVLEISQKEYETAMKWLRRTVRADASKEGSNVR